MSSVMPPIDWMPPVRFSAKPLAALFWSHMREPILAFALAMSALAAAVLFSPPVFLPEEPAPLQIENGETTDAEESALSPDDEETDEGGDSFAAIDGDELAAEEESPPWLEYRIKRGDTTLNKILKKIGADEETLKFFAAQKLKSSRRLRRGDYMQFRLDENQQLAAIRYKTSPEYYLNAWREAGAVADSNSKTESESGLDSAADVNLESDSDLTNSGGWRATEEPPLLVTVTRGAGGRIDSSLFAAADRAGFSDGAINLLINALETQVDFYREQRKGDRFRALYTETQDEDGKVIGSGRLLAFEYVSLLKPQKPRTIAGAYWDGKNSGYYTDDGESLQGAFLRAPLKFRRISSRFTNRRFHPVLKRWRPHRGVDYAAPSGTPVLATADGSVATKARQRGYGNLIVLSHANGYSTVYAHLRAFARGIRRGKKVKQGQVIGYVGQTGLATGPHLHYEFRVRGKHKDPLSTAVPKVRPPLSGEELSEFKRHSAPLLERLRTTATS